MKVTVQLFPHLSRITNSNEFQVDLDEGAVLMDLLGKLSEQFGSRFVDALYGPEDGPVDPYVVVAVNGEVVLLTERAGIELHEGSSVAFLSPLGGGGNAQEPIS